VNKAVITGPGRAPGRTTVHPLSIHNALREFAILLAIHASALAAEPMAVPSGPPDGLIAAPRDGLTQVGCQ
jgi:hypothetical protein